MCQAIIRYCSDSAKPILISGSILTFLAALGIGYVSYTSNALYEEFDKTVTQEKLSTAYYLQLLAAVYLALVTVLGCLAANYDQKHSIRALSIISSINFVLAVVVIVLIVPADQPSKLFEKKLLEAQKQYSFDKNYTEPIKPNTAQTNNGSATAQDQLGPKNNALKSAEDYTDWLDQIQAKGCCELKNAGTLSRVFPKSCCARSKVILEGNYFGCKEDVYKETCSKLVDSTRDQLMIVLALAALTNFYLALVSGIRAYKTLSYAEASQNAYS